MTFAHTAIVDTDKELILGVTLVRLSSVFLVGGVLMQPIPFGCSAPHRARYQDLSKGTLSEGHTVAAADLLTRARARAPRCMNGGRRAARRFVLHHGHRPQRRARAFALEPRRRGRPVHPARDRDQAEALLGPAVHLEEAPDSLVDFTHRLRQVQGYVGLREGRHGAREPGQHVAGDEQELGLLVDARVGDLGALAGGRAGGALATSANGRAVEEEETDRSRAFECDCDIRQ